MRATQSIGKEKMNQVYDNTSLSNLPDVGVDPGVQKSLLMYLQHLLSVTHYYNAYVQ